MILWRSRPSAGRWRSSRPSWNVAVLKRQATREGALGEKPLPRTHYNGEDPQPILIYKVLPQQSLDKVAAPVNLELRPFLLLEFLDLLSYISLIKTELLQSNDRNVLDAT